MNPYDLIIQAVQQLKAENAALATRVAALEGGARPTVTPENWSKPAAALPRPPVTFVPSSLGLPTVGRPAVPAPAPAPVKPVAAPEPTQTAGPTPDALAAARADILARARSQGAAAVVANTDPDLFMTRP